jgi:hypothetical protein
VSLDRIEGTEPVVDIKSGRGDVVLELPSNVC